MSQTGIVSPWVMKYALPATGEPGARRSAASRWASAALSM